MKKQDAQKVTTQMTSRDIQPKGNDTPREKTIVRGMATSRYLNSN